ncbi:hypothetical protein BDW22DRAFT_1361410 [Trametopsis cervina]|nr:hypothetical protein BDW22DRAFT_1361410 [Trametopsis cervina]
MEYAEASRQRLQLLLMLDQERAEAEKTVDEARGRIAHLEVGIGATLRAQDELIYRLRGVELEKQTLACKVKSSQALVVRQKSELNEARDDHNVLSNKLWVRQKKHKATVRSLLLTLLFLRRFALILGDRLAPIVRSRLTLLAQWRILSATKIAAQRRLLRQHEINREVLVQLQAAHLSTQEQQRISAHWQSLYVRSVENRDKAARKYKSVLLITKHRFNLTTRRLLTGLMFLWRLNLILSRRTAEVQSILRAFEYSAEPTIEGPEGPLARIEEVSEPSASGSSMVLLAEDTSTGLGISAHLDTESASAPASAVPIRLMIEMATQTEEPEADLEPEPEVVEEQEPKQYASCSVDTSDDAPTPSTADVGVMAKEPSEYEISLRKKVITLQEQLGAMAIMNDRYLARFVDTLSTKAPNANAPAQAVLPLPLPSAQPVPVRPSSPALLPFLQDSTARLPLAPRHVRPTLKRVIFSQPLISVPFPQPAYTKPIGTPSSPMTPTPVPKAGSSHRQAFLLTPGNESFN